MTAANALCNKYIEIDHIGLSEMESIQKIKVVAQDVTLYAIPRVVYASLLAAPIFIFKARRLKLPVSPYLLKGILSTYLGVVVMMTADLALPHVFSIPRKLSPMPLFAGTFGAMAGLKAWLSLADRKIPIIYLLRPSLIFGLVYCAFYWIDDYLYFRSLYDTLIACVDADAPPSKVRPYLRSRYEALRAARAEGRTIAPFEMYISRASAADLAARPDPFFDPPRYFFAKAKPPAGTGTANDAVPLTHSLPFVKQPSQSGPSTGDPAAAASQGERGGRAV